MDEQAVAAANLSSNLTDRLEERLGLNIAGGAANLVITTSAEVFLPTE